MVLTINTVLTFPIKKCHYLLRGDNFDQTERKQKQNYFRYVTRKFFVKRESKVSPNNSEFDVIVFHPCLRATG